MGKELNHLEVTESGGETQTQDVPGLTRWLLLWLPPHLDFIATGINLKEDAVRGVDEE